jgi:hypothetical protein
MIIDDVPTHFTNNHAVSMTLRDYFAAKAMQSLIHVQVKTAQQMTAETAYEWADAMMKARTE